MFLHWSQGSALSHELRHPLFIFIAYIPHKFLWRWLEDLQDRMEMVTTGPFISLDSITAMACLQLNKLFINTNLEQFRCACHLSTVLISQIKGSVPSQQLLLTVHVRAWDGLCKFGRLSLFEIFTIQTNTQVTCSDPQYTQKEGLVNTVQIFELHGISAIRDLIGQYATHSHYFPHRHMT